MSVLSLSPKEFWESTPVEICNALDFSHKLREEEIRDRWDIMRLQTFYLININLDKNNQLSDPEDLIKFPWDEKKIKSVEEPDWEKLEKDIKGIN